MVCSPDSGGTELHSTCYGALQAMGFKCCGALLNAGQQEPRYQARDSAPIGASQARPEVSCVGPPIAKH